MKLKTKKKLSIVLGVLIICLLIFLAMSFTGNPISKLIVDINSKKYVEENYSQIDNLKREVNYNFKTGGYSVLLEKTNSKDIKFYLEYDLLGKLKYDDYDYLIEKRFNPAMRLQNEYSDYLESKIKLNTYEDINYIIVETLIDEENFKEFEIDESLDVNKMKNYDTNLSISVDAKDREITEENVKLFLEDVIKQMQEEEIKIDYYTIYYDKYKKEKEQKVYIDGIFVEKIPSGNLDNIKEYIKE